MTPPNKPELRRLAESALKFSGSLVVNADYMQATNPQAVLSLLDEIEGLRGALEKFAEPKNWMLGKIFDPNGINFIGLTTASKALQHEGEKS